MTSWLPPGPSRHQWLPASSASHFSVLIESRESLVQHVSLGPGDSLCCSLPASGCQPITCRLFCLSSCRQGVRAHCCKHMIIPANRYPPPSRPHPQPSTSQRCYCTAPGDDHRFGSEVLARHHEYHRACELFRRETQRVRQTLSRPKWGEERAGGCDGSGFAAARRGM